MIANQRIIWSDNGIEKDLSVNLNRYLADSEVIPLVAADDYIFIASDFPFNHRYFYVSSPNALTSTITVEYWTGNEWRQALDIIDRTATAGATMAKSGVIQWRIDRDSAGWARQSKSNEVQDISKTGIYDMFWLRLSFSGDFTGTTAIKYIGQLFADDAELFSRYPDLNRSALMTAFAAGKTSWLDQHIIASEEMVADLRRRNIIASSGQIMNHELFKAAAIHKVAELIFFGLGRAYEEARVMARKYYDEAMSMGGFYEVDLTASGDLSTGEKLYRSTGWMTR